MKCEINICSSKCILYTQKIKSNNLLSLADHLIQISPKVEGKDINGDIYKVGIEKIS